MSFRKRVIKRHLRRVARRALRRVRFRRMVRKGRRTKHINYVKPAIGGIQLT